MEQKVTKNISGVLKNVIMNKEDLIKLTRNAFFFFLISLLLNSCSKVQQGYISPTMQYNSTLFVIPKGQVVTSVGITVDGSTVPINVTWVHIYDSAGNVVDSIFKKEYPVTGWKSGYNPKIDTTFAAIFAKLTEVNAPPIEVLPNGGQIRSTNSSLFVPSGKYTVDIQITNKVGTQLLKNAMTLQFNDPVPIETNDATAGQPAVGLLPAGTATALSPFYSTSAYNCPFLQMTVNRFADTPNVVYLKVVDRNGIPFNPKTGELFPRPATGLNPIPPNLQNLQQYAPDFYATSDTAIFIRYPIAPFPIASLGNAYLMYYALKTSSVIIDSTSTWSSNPNYDFYKGTSDSHYLGTYPLNKYDFYVRIPMRIQIPGAYIITEKVLNVTHR